MSSVPILPRRWTTADIPDQSGKTALVTGANSGLGLRTAEALAAKGARVLLACRNEIKVAAALEAVGAAATGPKPEVLPLDLADLTSVRRAADHVDVSVGAVDLLVNNAGVMAVPRSRTADGFDAQFGTNHLGHFALTGAILPALLRSPRPRVVTVSSIAAWGGAINPADPNWRRLYLRWPAYAQSKLANLLFTAELDRRARAAGTALTAIAAHPGLSATALYDRDGERGVAATLAAVPQRILYALAQPDHRGALPQLYAATMPDLPGNTYLGPGFEFAGYPRRTLRNPLAHSRAYARWLWGLSERLTGVRYEWPTGAGAYSG
ncbi:SDR family NAD(P)-dependent oxidoreductase [Nocardia yunnanensis]|uniref:SDR family NAD(P)-dependent oxidoreductase n=1 Tax=Nocardia yunnanensis TaxID=2382165 RepID=A0A386ZLU1_9NOCA|nr:oxidoreductase [Nocardia yunnanensis]AYF78273.1 SDR family NAD(P)-dependent oxidoreductase [Nocardia yunnanensis]